MTDLLSQRALNRATLARQYLLERAPLSAVEAIEHLAGKQSQAPLAPYVGLWTRLRDFAPGDLATLTEERQVVRLHVMRNTVHLVSARDALNWPALFRPLHAAQFSSNFLGGIEGVDQRELLSQSRLLLAERPRTRAELGRLFGERWPDAEPRALAYAATHLLVLCQVPPGNGASAGTLLIDGLWQGTWHLRDQKLRILPYVRLRPADRDALLAEAARLCAFVVPQAAHDIMLGE